MQCPICGQEMTQYKEEPCYNTKMQIEYKRTRYKCEKDDTWGRLEIPVGPMKQVDRADAHSK